MPEKKHLADLMSAYREYRGEVLLAKDELEVFRRRLGEVAERNNSQEVLAQVEHFENRFRVEKLAIDSLLHDLNVSTDALVTSAKENPTAADRRLFEVPEGLMEKGERFKELYAELKKEFYKFVATWL